MTLRVSLPRRTQPSPGVQRIDLAVGEFDLWFEVLGWEVPTALTGDFAVAAALLPAMARGEDLHLPDDLPVTPGLASRLPELQEIYLAWAPYLGMTLAPVRVAHHTAPPAPAAGETTLSFFSGGVDGGYTATRHRDTIDGLVLLRGIDMQLENAQLWAAALEGVEQQARHFDRPVVQVHTNVRFLGYENGLKWALHYQAGGLAAIAHLLAPGTMLLAASHTLDALYPFGSHPLLDPLWSSDRVRIIHEGAVPRTEKLRRLIREPVLLETLRVCWRDQGYNCGRCEKCLRTMTALTLLGAPTPSFPTVLDPRALAQVAPSDDSDWTFFDELVELERARPHPGIRKALQKVARRRAWREAAKQIDAALTGGRVTRWRRARLR